MGSKASEVRYRYICGGVVREEPFLAVDQALEAACLDLESGRRMPLDITVADQVTLDSGDIWSAWLAHIPAVAPVPGVDDPFWFHSAR